MAAHARVCCYRGCSLIELEIAETGGGVVRDLRGPPSLTETSGPVWTPIKGGCASIATSSSSVGELRSMLTAVTRLERFCDGDWATMLETGRVTAPLRRCKRFAAASRADRPAPLLTV